MPSWSHTTAIEDYIYQQAKSPGQCVFQPFCVTVISSLTCLVLLVQPLLLAASSIRLTLGDQPGKASQARYLLDLSRAELQAFDLVAKVVMGADIVKCVYPLLLCAENYGVDQKRIRNSSEVAADQSKGLNRLVREKTSDSDKYFRWETWTLKRVWCHFMQVRGDAVH